MIVTRETYIEALTIIENVENAGEPTISELTRTIRAFSESRDWGAFHTPRNLLLALVGEVGELAAELQWIGDADLASALTSAPKRTALEGELSDVATYLLRLCDVLDIDVATAINDKIAINEVRYPAERARGSSAKYHAYE
jgi:dCTP diphosphatase